MYLTHIQPQTWTDDYKSVLRRETITTPSRKVSLSELEFPSYLYVLAYELIWFAGFHQIPFL
ncbi:MAG: hypothetical protein ACFFCZ_00455 [Promethearchaeota archaeon]